MSSETPHDLDHASRHTFGRALAALSEGEARVLRLVKGRRFASRSPEAVEGVDSFGERLADQVAEFGGSWTFIVLFGAILLAWTLANVWLLAQPFDPYPFIFLNLMLSMLAAVQAPIIMMSQNRQAAKDRRNAAADYECNLKSEIEIMALHDKLDALRGEHLAALVASQQEQIELLKRLVEQRGATP